MPLMVQPTITGRAGTEITVAVHYRPQLDKGNADEYIVRLNGDTAASY